MVGTDDAVCVDSGVVGGCYLDCVLGAEVAVLELGYLSYYNTAMWIIFTRLQKYHSTISNACFTMTQ